MPNWHRVDPAALPELWPKYRPLLLRVLGRGDGCFDERDVLAMLLTDRWQLIAVDRGGETAAIGITEVVEFPRKRLLQLRYAAGDMDLILAGRTYLEDRARYLRCDLVQTHGRKGWGRLLVDWLPKWIVFQKELT